MKSPKNILLALTGVVILAVAVFLAMRDRADESAKSTPSAASPSTAGAMPATAAPGKAPASGGVSPDSTLSKNVPAANPVTSATASLARTDTSAVSTQQSVNPERPGEAAVEVKGTVYHLMPNQLGNFQRINIEPNAKITARVSFARGEEGDPVTAEVEDGGVLGGKQMGQVLKLDAQKTAEVQFQAKNQDGIYRVLLRQGADVKVLNFLVGKPETYQD